MVTIRNNLTLPWEHESEFLQINGVKQVGVNDREITVTCGHDNTAEIVKFFVLKGYEVIGVQRKEHGLDDIYQKYFENSLN